MEYRPLFTKDMALLFEYRALLQHVSILAIQVSAD